MAPATPAARDATAGEAPVRVWILNHYATPPDRGAGTRHYSLGRALVERGCDVTIFAAGFGHATGRELRVEGPRLSRVQVFDGVRFVWLRTFPYHGNSWRRLVNMASYAVLVVLAQIGRPAPEVVIGSTVHPLAALAGWLIARLRGARFIYEVRDLWPETLIDLGAMRADSGGARFLRAIEAFLVRRAESVITVLSGMSLYLETQGLPTDHVRYLPNFVDLAAADAATAASRMHRDGRIGPLLDELEARRVAGEVIFAWIGAHGRANALDVILRALAIANSTPHAGPPIHVLFVGGGPEKAALRRLAAELALPNVQFVDPIPKDCIPALLAAVDVGLVHNQATPVHRFGISFNKIFDYMAARKPILFACRAYRDPIVESGAGRSVEPDDPAALAAALIEMAALPREELERLGAAGRAFAEREHDLTRLGEVFAEIVVGPSAAPSPVPAVER